MPIFKREPDPPPTPQTPLSGKPAASPFGERSERVAAHPATPVSGASTYGGMSTGAAAASAPTVAAAPAAATPSASSPAPAQPVAPREGAAVLDKKTEITGTLHSQGNVLIEGCFHGEVDAKETVWVEKGAQADGQLRANDAVISGSFDGEVACQHRLQVAAAATVTGEIKTPVLVIEEGATINCRFIMKRTGGR